MGRIAEEIAVTASPHPGVPTTGVKGLRSLLKNLFAGSGILAQVPDGNHYVHVIPGVYGLDDTFLPIYVLPGQMRVAHDDHTPVCPARSIS